MSRIFASVRRSDPRHYQIAVLSLLLLYGVFVLRFDVTPARIALVLLTALGAQYACGRAFRAGPYDPRSALISALSLCLLLRTGNPWIAALAAVVAIAGKFLVRVNGRHVFNPTNLAIVSMMLLSRDAWISPGQWGNPAFFALLVACLGGLVVNRAMRSDVSLAFLAFYAAFLAARSLHLGEPLTIPAHRLMSGSLLLFTFFMISDPRTTPESRLGRVIFAFLVAWAGWYWQFRMFHTSGPVWALVALSPVVPILNRLLPGPRYEWARSRQAAADVPKGASRETNLDPSAVPAAGR